MNDIPADDEAAAERMIKELDERGIGVCMSWNYGARDKSLASDLTIARIQKKLSLPVGINATGAVYSVFDGSPATAYVGEDGKPYFDKSVVPWFQSGSPFSVESRVAPVKAQVDFFAKAYNDAGVDVDFAVADWECDLPIDCNGAWAANKKAPLSREKIPKIDDYLEFQKSIRTIRADLQKRIYADTLKGYFPGVLVGNYGVYPNDGYRYWFDFFEKYTDGTPFKADAHAKFRQWFQEWPLTGYTYAMPVVYPRYDMFGWYDFDNADFRWFKGLLLNASNAPACTPGGTPVIAFVKYFTCDSPAKADPGVKQLSETAYRELLWHMTLRGTHSFYNWCPDKEAVDEAVMLQQVYAEELEYAEFLEKGVPITFDTPSQPGPVVSGLRLGNRLLVRRTDFSESKEPVTMTVDGKAIAIPRVEGKCQLISLP